MNKYERLNQARPLVEHKKRVAAYCRVSTDKEDQANSFESQQRYFRDYIERMPDWALYEIFADEGISGTNTKKRRAFNRMIDCAKHGAFDLILTKEISRFARNTLDSIYYTRNLKKRGVGVIFLNDNINTLDADAELRLTIMSSIAQEESRKTSERVKWGQKRRMEQGVVFGRDMLGYHVRNGQMFVDADGAKIVRLIFDKFVREGKGSHAIARELSEAGCTTVTGKTMWQNTVIYKILRNEKYCGDLIQKKTFTPDYLSHEKKYNKGEEEFVILKDHHEPIISRELFQEANRILDERSLVPVGKSKHSNRYCFSGKIKCGICGGTFGARYTRRKDGSVYEAWRCLARAQHGMPHIDGAGHHVGCCSESVRNEDAMYIMRHVTGSFAMAMKPAVKSMMAAIAPILSKDMNGTDINELHARKQAAEKRRSRLLELYMSQDIDREEFITTRAKCDSEIDELDDLIGRPDKRDVMTKRQDELMLDITDAIHDIVNGTVLDEVFCRNLIDHMVVHDKNHIDVYLQSLSHKWSYTSSGAAAVPDNEANTPENDPVNERDDARHFCTRSGDRRVGPFGNGGYTCLSTHTQFNGRSDQGIRI